MTTIILLTGSGTTGEGEMFRSVPRSQGSGGGGQGECCGKDVGCQPPTSSLESQHCLVIHEMTIVNVCVLSANPSHGRAR